MPGDRGINLGVGVGVLGGGGGGGLPGSGTNTTGQPSPGVSGVLGRRGRAAWLGDRHHAQDNLHRVSGVGEEGGLPG